MNLRIVDLREVPAYQQARWMVDLSEDLRPSDLDEIAATSDLEPAVALTASLMLSDHAWVILKDGAPICVYGCAPDERAGRGVVWMMGSPAMDEPAARIFILRRSRHYIGEMHRAYPTLWNNIDARNERSLRWLEWCGFRVTEALPDHGSERRLFYTFERHEPTCATR